MDMETGDGMRPLPVRVTTDNYAFDGWLVCVFEKRNAGGVRCVVEDADGSLSFATPTQLRLRQDVVEEENAR